MKQTKTKMTTLKEKVANSIVRNKSVGLFKYTNSNKQQALFVSLLGEEKCTSKYELIVAGRICTIDNCSKYVVLEDEKENKLYFHMCRVVDAILEMLNDPMTSNTSRWMKLRKAIVTSDDMVPFMVDFFLEMGYAFTVRRLPNFRENIWRRVFGDKNSKTTLNVPHIIDAFAQNMSEYLPLYSFMKREVKLDDDVSVFFAGCEPLLSDEKREQVEKLEDKYKCKLIRSIMQTHLQAISVGMSILFFVESFFLIKDKPDIYYTMSQAFKTLGKTPDRLPALTTDCSYGVFEVMPFFLEEDSMTGLQNALSYVYNLCIDIGDKKMHMTLDSMIGNSDVERTHLSVAEIQEKFFQTHVIMCCQPNAVHLTDLLSGCFGSAEHSADPDPEIEAILSLMRNDTKEGTRHLLLDNDLFLVIDKEYVINQKLGGGLFGMLVAIDKNKLGKGTRMPVYPMLARLLLSRSIRARRWMFAILHYWLFEDATAALALCSKVTADHILFFDSVGIDTILYFVTRNNVDLFLASNARVVAYKLLLVLVNLIVASVESTDKSQLFLAACSDTIKNKVTNLVQIEKALVCKHTKLWPHLQSKSKISDIDNLNIIRSSVSYERTTRPTPMFSEIRAMHDMEKKKYTDMVRLFAVIDTVCLMDMKPTLALWHLQTTNTEPKYLFTKSIPIFYCEQKQGFVDDDAMMFLPSSRTEIALKSSTVQLSSVCVDKPIKDCQSVVLGGNKQIQPFQLYRDFEINIKQSK